MPKQITIILICWLLLPEAALSAEINSSPAAETPIAEKITITSPVVRIIDSENFKLIKEFYPFGTESAVQGANISTADLDKDGFKEIIIAAGRNAKPLVKIFDHEGNFKYEFSAYAEKFTKGFKVTVADLYNDGSPEIITAPNEGGSAHIKIFDNLGFLYFGFFAFEEKYYTGASVTVGDVNNDGQKEIIVGPGYSQEPLVKIFDNYGNFIKGFFPYELKFKSGINVLAADLDNDKIDEIITAPYLGREPLVKVFKNYNEQVNEFLAYPSGFWGGVNLAVGDIDNDNNLEILTGAGYGGSAQLRIFDSLGEPKINPNLIVFDNFMGGISIAGGDINKDGSAELLAATQTISPNNKYQTYKTIEIDLAKQKLYAYFKGLLEKDFIVSTGTAKYPTPQGTFQIKAKIPLGTMTGYYGPDNPDNYSLPNVPNILPFYKNYAIHGAYWHWSFGRRVSHGCVNLKLKDAAWMFDWADIGVPVIIYSSK
jgi:hypothetical protein